MKSTNNLFYITFSIHFKQAILTHDHRLPRARSALPELELAGLAGGSNFEKK